MATIVLNEPTLSFLIKQAYKNYGFVSAFIYGPQGVGKTTYGLKVLYYAYGSWDLALKYTLFDLETTKQLLENAFTNNRRIKAILLDDVGTWLIKYSWHRNPSIWFSKLFNMVRSVCSGVLFTSVEVSDIIKFIRDKVIFRVSVKKLSFDRSLAVGYKVNTLPSLDQYVEKIFEDEFGLSLPGYVRTYYELKRREALSSLFKAKKEGSLKQVEEAIFSIEA